MFLLKPFISIIEKMRFVQKLILMALLFGLPLAFSISQNISVFATQLDFIEREHDGIDYLPALLTVIKETQIYRGLKRLSQSGNIDAGDKLPLQLKKIDAGIKTFDAIIDRQKDKFNISDRWNKHKTQWDKLIKPQSKKSQDGNFEELTKLIDSYLTLMGEIANDTNIALDPETDTYFTLTAAYNQAPLMMEFSGKSRALGASAINTKNLNFETRIEIAA